MILKVIIKRTIAEGMEKAFFKALRNIRVYAMHQEGYISGETLLCAEDTNKVMVISTWQSIDDWKKWIESEKRQEADRILSQYQANETVYEPYVLSKYKAAATLGFPRPLQKMDL